MARGLQKAQSQLKNAGPTEKSAEQRAADRKAAAANSVAQVCLLCRQTFSNVAKEPMLREHFESKHPKETDIKKAFPNMPAPSAAKCQVVAANAAKSGSAAEAPERSTKQKSKDAVARAAAALAAAGGAPPKPKAAKKTKQEEDVPETDPVKDEADNPGPEGTEASEVVNQHMPEDSEKLKQELLAEFARINQRSPEEVAAAKAFGLAAAAEHRERLVAMAKERDKEKRMVELAKARSEVEEAGLLDTKWWDVLATAAQSCA